MNIEIDDYEIIYCAVDNEYKIYCSVCDKLCIERFYRNHLKSQTHTNNFHKKTLQINNFNQIWSYSVKYVINQLLKVNQNTKLTQLLCVKDLIKVITKIKRLYY